MGQKDELQHIESLIFKTIQREVAPTPSKAHPSLDALLGFLAQDLPPEQQEEVSVHLALCPDCARRNRRLERLSQKEQQDLMATAHFGTFRAFVRARRSDNVQGWERRLRDLWVHLVTLRWPAYGTGLAAVTLALCLALLLPPALRHWSQERQARVPTGTTSIRGLPQEQLPPELRLEDTPQAILQAIDLFSGYPPSRAMAMSIGFLRAVGVPLGEGGAAFERVDTYVTQPGDSWESVAGRFLGTEALWPILILLNRERTERGEFPPVGTVLRVPEPFK